MAQLGRLGGRGRTPKVLGISDHVADGSLREKARRRLVQILEGDDEAAELRAATAALRLTELPRRPKASAMSSIITGR